MRYKRPDSYTPLAVFNFIFGGLGLLCAVFSFARTTVIVNGQDMTPVFEAFMEREVPNYRTYRLLGAVGGMALGIGFIVSGIGLLTGGWGRIAAFIVGPLSIAHQIGLAIFQLAAVGPAQARFLNQVPGFGFGFLSSFLSVIVVGVAITVVIYDLVLVFVLVGSGPPRLVGEMDDEFDDDPRMRRRRHPHDYDDYDSPRPRRALPADEDDDFDERRPRPRRRDDDYDDEPHRR